jgi:hypothetical protein
METVVYRGKVTSSEPLIIFEGRREILVLLEREGALAPQVGSEVEVAGQSLMSRPEYAFKKLRYADVVAVRAPEHYCKRVD